VIGVGFDAHASNTLASAARPSWVIFTKNPSSIERRLRKGG
jgi:hypothetical protein